MDTATCFHVSSIGQIESANFPIGPDCSQLFFRYEVVTGPDWDLVSGLVAGITQCSSPRQNDKSIVFNMPLEFSYKSTSPFGWPQIVFSMYGKNFWGTETSLGYGRMHVPIFGTGKRQIIVPILIPKCSSWLTEIMYWLTGKNPELRDPKILAEGTKNRGMQTDSYGELIVSLQTISRGASRMGYEWDEKQSAD